MSDSLEVSQLAAHPEVLAVVILILGVLCARLARMGADAGLAFTDRAIARFSTSGSSIISPGLIRFTGIFIFWAVLALAVTLALNVLGIAGLSLLLPLTLQYVPKLIFGLLIIVAGHLLGLLARSFALRFLPDVTPDSALPRLIYALFLLIAIVVGVKQINIDLSFITQLLLIMVAVVGGGLAAAFGLGSRQYVANLLAYREIARLHVGEDIMIDDIQGRVVEVGDTFVAVETADGVVSIPAAWFADRPLRRVEAGDESA